MADENTEKNEALDLSGLGSFDFTPAWAKNRPDDKAKYARFEEPAPEKKEERRAPRKSFDGERKPRDRKSFGEGRPAGERRFGDRPPRRDDRPPREFIKALDVDIRILPSQKELGPIIRQLQTKHTAYALKQLAYLFLDNPQACVLRIANKKDAAEEILFHQCKACGFVTLSDEELANHVVAEHLSDYYDSEVVDCEPPKGTFNCVARCGVTGVLLGPPNLHGFDARVREVLREKCPDMPESVYRARIEMVRDPEVVEQWRTTATKKTVYKRKGEEAAIEREAAEMEFRRTILPGLMSTAKSIDVSTAVVMKSPCKALIFACKDALSKERRFPVSLLFALRGAFHHRKLEFFRANDPRGPEFVVAQKFQALDVEHAIPELAALVKYVAEHPCTTQNDVIAALSAGDAAKAEESRKTLSWLIEKGQLVGYFNGVLAIPADHPKYHPPKKAANAEKPALAETAESAPIAEAEAAPAEESAAAPAEEPVADPQ